MQGFKRETLAQFVARDGLITRYKPGHTSEEFVPFGDEFDHPHAISYQELNNSDFPKDFYLEPETELRF